MRTSDFLGGVKKIVFCVSAEDGAGNLLLAKALDDPTISVVLRKILRTLLSVSYNTLDSNLTCVTDWHNRG